MKIDRKPSLVQMQANFNHFRRKPAPLSSSRLGPAAGGGGDHLREGGQLRTVGARIPRRDSCHNPFIGHELLPKPGLDFPPQSVRAVHPLVHCPGDDPQAARGRLNASSAPTMTFAEKVILGRRRATRAVHPHRHHRLPPRPPRADRLQSRRHRPPLLATVDLKKAGDYP
jgi:hypothetical protein